MAKISASTIINIIESVINDVRWDRSSKTKDSALIGKMNISWDSREKQLEFSVKGEKGVLSAKFDTEAEAKAWVSDNFAMLNKSDDFGYILMFLPTDIENMSIG